jgi:hypothetical protein
MQWFARWLRVWPAVGLALVTVGCGGEEFVAATDEGGLGPETSLIDAPSPAEGGLMSDGAVTSDAGDATVPPDEDSGPSQSDGGDAAPPPVDAGDGGPATFSCAALTAEPTGTDIVFCSDFDEQNAPKWNWASDPTIGGGNDAVDTKDYLSPPNAFAASNVVSVNMTAVIASLGQQLTGILQPHIDYAFQMFVKEYGTVVNPSIPLAQLVVGSAGDSSALSLDLVLKDGNLYLVQLFTGTDGGSQTTTPVTIAPIATSTWVHVEMLLDRSSTNWLVTVFIDDVSKLTAQPATTPSNTNIEVDLGLLDIVPPPGVNEIVFDNVIVRAY